MNFKNIIFISISSTILFINPVIADNADYSLKESSKNYDKKDSENTFTKELIDDKKEKHIRFFFFSDAHSNEANLDKFINQVNKIKPDLVIDGGDMVYDGTEPELDRAYKKREKIEVPLYLVSGSHDVEHKGVFKKPPRIVPPIQSFDKNGFHFILLDNADRRISDELFEKLEQDLESNKGKIIIVAMHTPAFLSKEPIPFYEIIGKYIPLFSFTMINEEKNKHFTSLMSKYKVRAVFSGHTHAPDEMEKDGVKYFIVSATGGFSAKITTQNEYMDISLKNNDIKVKRVPLKKGFNSPFSYFANIVEFHNKVNSFNHDNLGWNYLPSVNVQYEFGARFFENNKKYSKTISTLFSMEKIFNENLSIISNLSIDAGLSDFITELRVGYKHRIIGDYNRGLFVQADVGANAGILTGNLSGGVSAGISTGLEYNNFTLSLGYELATNYNSKAISLGYRF